MNATQPKTTPISEEFTKQVRQAVSNLHDKQGLRVRFIGYTDDAPLAVRDERIYGNNLAVSKARAQRVALAMQEALELVRARRVRDRDLPKRFAGRERIGTDAAV